MPHIILEHNLSAQDLEDETLINTICKKLHRKLSQQETVKLESIKTRSIEVSNLIFADNLKKVTFAHVQLKLLAGRSEELKKKMSEALLEVLQNEIPGGSLSVEVLELESYSKN